MLCFWQTQRLEWKNNLIDSINSNYNSVLDEFPSNDENSQYEFMNTSVKGQLLIGKKMFFYKFNLKGQSGYEIVLPMEMTNKKFIYVILGWIPFDSKDNFELDEVFKNSFYGSDPFTSSITFIFNDQPSVVKVFKTINYIFRI